MSQFEVLIAEAEGILDRCFAEDRDPTEAEQKRIDELVGPDGRGGAVAAAKKKDTQREVIQKLASGGAADGSPGERADFTGASAPSAGRWRTPRGGRAEVLDLGSKLAPKSSNPHLFGEFVAAKVTGQSKGFGKDVLNFMGLSSNPSGGYTVPRDLLSEFVDLARAKSRLSEAGLRTILTDGSYVDVAVVARDPEFVVKAENDPFPDETITLSQIASEVQTVGCVVTGSRELFEDSLNIGEIVTSVMARALAQQVDRFCLSGFGEAFRGILGWTGLPEETSVGPLDWQAVSKAAIKVLTANHDVGAAIMHPNGFGVLQSFLTGTDSDTVQAWLPAPPLLSNVSLLDSSNMPIDQALIGDFSKAALVLRQEPLLEISNVAGDTFKRHQVAIKLTWRGQLVVLDPSAFCALRGITQD